MVRPNILLHQEYYPWIRGCTLHRKPDFFIDAEFIFFCLSNDGSPLWHVEINTDVKNYFWCTIFTLNTNIEVKRPMIPLSRLQCNGSTDHKRIWTPCVFRISPHVKQRLQTFSSSSLALLIVCLFFFSLHPPATPLLSSSSDTYPQNLIPITLRFKTVSGMDVQLPQSVSSCTFSEMDFDQFLH